LKDISLDSLYDVVSVIQQNVFLFNKSIKDNITMFKEFNINKVEEKGTFKELMKLRGYFYSLYNVTKVV